MDKNNIRQVGQVQGLKKIYIEDYVMTYMKQLSEKDGTCAHMAVLIGEYEKKGRAETFCIYGAVEIPSGETGIGYEMDSAAWAKIYADIRRYFPSKNIIGWYLTADEPELEKNEWLLRFYKENFGGRDKLLFYYNPAELEEVCYTLEDGQLKAQEGYFLFYERNEAMQAFLVDQEPERPGFRQGREMNGIPVQTQSRATQGRRGKKAKKRRAREADKQQSNVNVKQQSVEPKKDDTKIQSQQQDKKLEEIQSQKERQSQKEKQSQKPEATKGTTEPQSKQQNETHKNETRKSSVSSYLAGAVSAAALLLLCLVVFQYFDKLAGLEESIEELSGNLSKIMVMGSDAQSVSEEESEIEKETEKEKETGKETEKEKETETEKEKEKSDVSVLEIETLPGGVISKSSEEEKNTDTETTTSDKKEEEKTDTVAKEDKTEGEDSKEDNKTEQEKEEEKDKAEEKDDSTSKEKQPESDKDTSAETEEDKKTNPEPEVSENTTEEKQEPQEQTMEVQERYVVQPGDTLSAICQRHYQNVNMMEKVMEANGITNPNGILAGDVLLLP